jgi:DNA-binding transcriptional LysR family regulator
MNLRQIRYFCEVVAAGSAAQAAEKLCVAPTAISMQLAQLEQHLGGELFDRSRRPMELTSLGKFFHPRAKELLSLCRHLDEEAREIAAGKTGWIGLGFVRSAIFSILPNAVRAFRGVFPDVHFDLIEVLSEYQPEQLRERRIDVGISRFMGTFEESPDLSYTIMLDEPFVAAVPIDHPIATRSSVTAADFSALPFILYPKDPKSPFGEKMLSSLREAGGTPVLAYEAIEIYTALALVGAGLGGTLVGRSIAENNRGDVVFVPLSDVDAGTTVVAITRKNEDSKLVAAFLKTIVQ